MDVYGWHATNRCPSDPAREDRFILSLTKAGVGTGNIFSIVLKRFEACIKKQWQLSSFKDA